MPEKRSYILTIGGFDPSGGAGVLADIKTFEQHKVQGMAVNTANTVQSEDQFSAVNWLSEELILQQLDFLLEFYGYEYIKIGLIPSFNLINEIHARVAEKGTRLIWDPILKASAGFNMEHELSQLERVLEKVYFVTPNWDEVKLLSDEQDAMQGAQQLAKSTNVYLKGGHNAVDPGRDYIFWNGKQYNLRPKGNRITEKHGSGCVLSSALAANLTRGYAPLKACLKAKEYITGVLESNKTLLAYHKR